MVARHARLIERELSADAKFEIIADVRNPRRHQDSWEGLAGRPRDQLIVVELVVQKHIPQRPLQSDVFDIVA
jgi:hypothetical protein